MGDPTWRVVGGAKGGILVREGQDLKSPEASSRLSKDAVVRELELQGERLRYELLEGTGPETGWVSIKLKGADLVVRHGRAPPKTKKVDFGAQVLPAPAGAKGRSIWIFSEAARGKVQSFVALGVALRQAGYLVRVFTERCWQALVARVGLGYVEAGLSAEDAAQGRGRWDGEPARDTGVESYLHFAKAVLAEAEASLPDLILYDVLVSSVAMGIGQKYGVCILPVWFRLPDVGMAGSLWELDALMWQASGLAPVQELGWEALAGTLAHPRTLIAATPLEMEGIADEGMKQQLLFTHKQSFTGYWVIPESVQLQLDDPLLFGVHRDLEDFLKAGAPPVYVGWGQVALQGDWALQMIMSAVKAGGFRAVVFTGKSGLSEELLRTSLGGVDPDGFLRYAKANILFVSAAPHEWLFPKCRCAMLTGGGGTVGVCLRAGLPMLMSPADENDPFHSDLVEKIGAGLKTAPLAALEKSELTESLKKVASDCRIAKKIKELQKQVLGEMGVPGAVVGINMLLKNEVLSGATRREWEERQRVLADAAETDEEPVDGVLRPPPVDSTKAQAAKEAALIAAPDWLKPDGKGKILIFTIPLKGHIIHLIRIAQWFVEHPAYEVTVVCSEESVSDIPKGANIVTYGRIDFFSRVDELLVQQANLDANDNTAHSIEEGMQIGDDVSEFTKKMLEAIVDLKPNVFVTDEALAHLPTDGFLPAVCKVYKVPCILVVSPSIKENRVRQYKAQAKLKKKTQPEPEKFVETIDAATESGQEKHQQGHQQAAGSPVGENGIPDMPWKPESMSAFKVMQVMRAVPTIPANPPVQVYPSSNVLHAASCHDHELFTGAFLPLPKPINGCVQHGRSAFSATMSPDLLEWLFADDDPVVYVAFGTIVSKHLPPAFVARLAEALDGGAWRVLLVLPRDLQARLPPGLVGPCWRVESFAPQGEILRCERVRCFVSHCGANSTMEAMACGVPLVCMPFYMDQFDWAWAVRRRCHAGVQVDCHCEAATLRTAVSEVLTEPSYRENAVAMAHRMAQQSDAIMSSLGSAMAPKARLGPGVSVLAAIIVGLLKGQDVKPIFRLVAQTA